ncbi:hypothetical protein BCV70DRAFT_198928 [Testicularia cyperi]|uniref:tRNA-intron lyase n=1 Tax=Testicularia cyperi TaxID=1882483 RepID=A0A317XT73_9BASI|nr:hypothetical protein BCV70DRAFT_198928 [Testicularia cyperi]
MPRQRNTTGWAYSSAEGSLAGAGAGAASASRSTGTQGPSLPRVVGAGKRGTAQKNQLYARPLPVRLDTEQHATSSPSAPHAASSLWNTLCTTLTLGFYTPTGPSTSTVSPEGGVTSQDSGSADAALVSVLYDRKLQTVWVSDMEQGLRMLWRRGFFGKGNLSRSEPAWRQRKINEIDAMRQGRLTAEQLTQQRREERKALKIERARAAVRAGQQLPDGILALGGEVTDADRIPGASHDELMADIERQVEEQMASEEDGAAAKNRDDLPQQPANLWTGEEEVPDIVPGQARIKGLKYFAEEVKANQARKAEQLAQHSQAQDGAEAEAAAASGETDVVDMERMQLSLVETFFLAGMLGCLEIRSDAADGSTLSLQDFYRCCLESTLPAPLLGLRERGLAERHLRSLYARPDNPFLINYVAYHHFRSLGWVVKTGIKFCADLLLYKKGPVFSHAEFAVVVIPAYEDPADQESSPFPAHPNAGQKDWIWFSTINRVQSQVLKTLILAHVFVPSLQRCPPSAVDSPQAFVDNLRSGKSYAIKEVAIRRWVPARMKP